MTDQTVANVVARYKKACGCQGVHDQGQQGAITRPTPLAAEQQVAVAPPGWEGPVKEMKKDKDIDNPWALAWYMKNKGDTPHKASDPIRFRLAHAQMKREASRFKRATVEVAMEFPTEDALHKYLHDHPNADKSKHKVKKQEGGEQGGKGGDASPEAHKANARAAETTKHFDEMKSLKTKVENADPVAKKKFDHAYSKLFENGEAAAKDASKLIQKFEHLDENSQAGAAVMMLHHAVSQWEQQRAPHALASGKFTYEKMREAEQTASYAKQVDDKIGDLQKALSGGYD